MENFTDNEVRDYSSNNMQNSTNNNAAINGNFDMLIPQMVKNMNFVGIVTIIIGALNCITIIGLPFGLPMVFMGSRLRDSANFYSIYVRTKDSFALFNAFDNQNRFFRIQKILFIISIILGVLAIAFYIVLIAVLVSYNEEIFST
mgnify:CR=1 FL=1